MLKKFFDEQVNIPKSQLEKLYYVMADINKIDAWHKYMTNPQPICDFECVYDWRDDVRDKTFHANSKFTMIYNRELQYVHYTCLLYTSPSPRDYAASRMPSSA